VRCSKKNADIPGPLDIGIYRAKLHYCDVVASVGLLLDPYIAEVPLVERIDVIRINSKRRKDDATW
jgi:hypothetical protein